MESSLSEQVEVSPRSINNITASTVNGEKDLTITINGCNGDSNGNNLTVPSLSNPIASSSQSSIQETNRQPLTRTISSTSSSSKSHSITRLNSSTSWSENHHSVIGNGNGSKTNSPESNNKPLPSAPSLAPSAELYTYSSSPARSRPTSTLIRTSSLSVGTSNSSRPSSSHPTTTLTTSISTEELDPTALLIRRLYERLEEQGVPGDGWDEGRERSRDGIINREEAEGAMTVGRSKGKGIQKGVMTDEVLENGQISKKEEFVMKRVDRYGFFSDSHPAALASQHHRLAVIQSEPFAHLTPSPSPFRRKSITPSTPKSVKSPSSSPKSLRNRSSTISLRPSLDTISMALESKRITKWSEMLLVASRDSGGNTQEWTVNSSWWEGRKGSGSSGKYRKFQRRVFKGVPDRWRRAVWGLEMEKFAREELEKGDSAVLSLEEIIRQYHAYVALPSNQDIQIDLDVPRTISGHVLFHTRYGQGQRALFHILHAFGLHCEDIGGYCQGMGPIAATFLSYFEPERAYACMVRLFDQYGLRHIFEPGFPGLIEAFYVQERLVELLMPEVHKAFGDHGISTSSYATKWYITLFTNSFPFETQLRLWDGLLLEGIDFLVITSLAIIWSFQQQFIAPNATFESILSALSSYFLVDSDDDCLRWIRKTLRRSDLREKMNKWRLEWKGFVKDGSAPNRVT